jgi:chemotaxis protein MotA
MDRATAFGLVAAWGLLVAGFAMEGGRIASLFQFSALLIVVGGSLGATLVSFRMRTALNIPRVLRRAFLSETEDPLDTLETLVLMADRARKKGLLTLEREIEEIPDRFLRKGLQLVVDGNDPETIRQILTIEIEGMHARHRQGEEFFLTWGGFSPTLGIIGTVLGLIRALEELAEPSRMGGAVALAFIATLYGVAFANLFLIPISNKLKQRDKAEMAAHEMALAGILALQAGESPRTVETKMSAFLAPGDRERREARREVEGE